MILKGSQRGGAKQLGLHLLKTAENEHVEIHDVRGFMTDDVVGAALLRKTGDGRGAPFPRRTYPTASVTGMPSAVKPLSTAMRIWSSAT